MPARYGNKHAFIAAYLKTGSVGEASKAAGIRPGVHYRWLKKHPEYEAAFEAARAEFAAKMADHASQKASPGSEVEQLRAEISRLDRRITDLSRNLRRLINAKATPRAPRQRPTEAEALLDQIARGMAKKPFSKLSQEHQDAVRTLAERVKATAD